MEIRPCSFLAEDVMRCVPFEFSIQLLGAGGAEKLLRSLADLAVEYAPQLAEYPEAQHEQLDAINRLLRALGAAREGPELAGELLHPQSQYGINGAALGSLLACLAPRPELAEPLARASTFKGPVAALAQCALAACRGEAPPSELARLEAQRARLAERLSSLRPPLPLLRPSPRPEDFKALADEVKMAYRRGGADACRRAISRAKARWLIA